MKRLPYILVGLLFLVYVTYRAYRVPITADEAVSYMAAKALNAEVLEKRSEGVETYVTLKLTGFAVLRSANMHYLNSALTVLSTSLLGEGEFPMRLPNVLAFILYMVFAYRLLGFAGNEYVRFAGFLLMLMQPLLIDFFAMTRGYGMATAFVITSLYYFVAYYKGERSSLTAAYVWAMVAAWAQFIAFNYFLALIASGVLMLFPNVDLRSLATIRESWKRNKKLMVWNAVFLVVTLGFLLLQTATGQFYIGSLSIFDSVYSLSWTAMYEKASMVPLAKVLAVVVMFVVVILLLLSVRKLLKERELQWYQLPLVVLLISYGITVCQWIVLDLKLPENRTGIYFVPLFVLSVVFLYRYGMERLNKLFKPVLIGVTLLMAVNFVNGMNVRYAMYSPFDANAKTAYQLFKNETVEKGSNRVNADWMFTGALFYYRWLDKDPRPDIVTIWPKEFKQMDTTACFYYLFDTMSYRKPVEMRRLQQFPGEKSSISRKVNCK